MTEPVIRDAATVALLRDGADGLEVLLLRRHAGHVFGANAEVFPGGAVDAADAAPGSGHDGHVLPWMTAIRECFEEAGILVACRCSAPVDRAAREALRAALNAQRIDWATVVERLALRFDPAALVAFAHWTTPPGAPRRYATQFFAARAPAGAHACADGVETIQASWRRPCDALAAHDAEQIVLMRPTRATLERLAGHTDVDSALAALVVAA